MRCRILVLFAFMGCQDKKSEPPPHPPPPSPSLSYDGVTLIQPGVAPRQALRYHLTRGTQATSELVYGFGIKNDGQGEPMPELVIELDTTVDDVLADGTAKLRITIGRTSVRDRPGSDAASDLMRGEAAAMQGVVITEALAPDGKVSDAHVQIAAGHADTPHAQLDNLCQSLKGIAMRLPHEPVGMGATWRERRVLPEGGIQAVVETTYTLASISGDTVAYTSAGALTGKPQTIEQDGLTAEVTDARGHSEAKGQVDLSRFALELLSTTAFMTTMNIVAPKGTPGAGSSTIEVTMAIQLTPSTTRSEAPGPGSAQGAHNAP